MINFSSSSKPIFLMLIDACRVSWLSCFRAVARAGALYFKVVGQKLGGVFHTHQSWKHLNLINIKYKLVLFY